MRRLFILTFLLTSIIAIAATSDTDTVSPDARYQRLTDADYREVADMLGVDIPSIKAVVDIEAGAAHQGFYQPGKALINFDLSIYRKMATKHKINLSRYQKSHAVIFAKPNTSKYGSYQAAQWARLSSAMTIDSVAAIEGTFWGMFQIGGFNWKLCACSSPAEFMERMNSSELAQLELFAELLLQTGMVEPLRKHNWAAFARRYNGASYAKRNYHGRMAQAYKKYSKQAGK